MSGRALVFACGMLLVLSSPARAVELVVEGGYVQRLVNQGLDALGGGTARVGLGFAPRRTDRVEVAAIGGFVGTPEPGPGAMRWGGLSVRYLRLLAPGARVSPYWAAAVEAGWGADARGGGFLVGGQFEGGLRLHLARWFEFQAGVQVGVNGIGPGLSGTGATIFKFD